MTATEPLTLHAVISRVLDESSLNDPREIAEKAAAMIPPAEQVRLLTEALVPKVREIMATRRNTALSNAFKPSLPSFQQPVIGGSIQVSPKRGNDFRPSAKVSGIRDWWSDLLRERVHVGEQRWMPLGSCGATELLFAENTRRAKAEKEVARAKQYMRLRELLDKYEVDTVDQLPPDAAKAAWS